MLNECEYTRFVWFNKYGNFSHFMESLDIKAINHLADLCLNDKHEADWHYDVIGLHKNDTISSISLAEMEYAKRKKYQY
jgi:hypothetical protein